ncbi:MAG: hypothetical protein M3O89_06185 [Actinomycetota bacterium]|nr:hypothetical protein [Actinomycetota bacterium]
MKRFAAALAFLLAVAAVIAGGAGSRTSKSAFEVFVEPTISAASNGLTLETELEGSFNVAGKTASGSGTFELTAGSTVLDSGTFTLTRLVAFQFYGCGEVTTPDGPISLPPGFCGGRVILAVHATSSLTGQQTDGLYEVNCQIHDPGGQAPPGTSEGVKVNARGINFNKHVTGDNLFVMTP